jgi:hypothetical protein
MVGEYNTIDMVGEYNTIDMVGEYNTIDMVGEYNTIDMVGENPKKNQLYIFFWSDHPLRNARERSYCKLSPWMQFLWLP